MTPILNGPQINSTKLFNILKRRITWQTTDELDLIVSAYTTYGDLTTIGNVYPLAQAIHETGWFSSDRWLKSNNSAGIGATNDGAWGNTFPSIAAGIIAQYAHLLCYALTDKEMLYHQLVLSDLSPRKKLLNDKKLRGIAKHWESLNSYWAYPGTTYGQTIVTIGNALMK